MKVPPIICAAFCCLMFNIGTSFAVPPKVIIDTDFNTIFDDGQVAVMAAQLYAQGVIDLLGFTIPSGNEWRDQEVAECLKAVERLGIEDRVKVYIGSQYPLLHDYKSYLYTTAFAYLVHPEFATDVRDLWLDMNTTFDQNYGKSIVYASDPYPSIGLLQDSKVIFHLDNSQFYAFYVDLLTRPVPVKFHGPPHEDDD
jgi:inosine-uridine nucleoside N-ribohydrolase